MLIYGHAIEIVDFAKNKYDCEMRPGVIQAVAHHRDEDGTISVMSVCEITNPDFEAGKKRLLSVLRRELKGYHGGFTKAQADAMGYAS